MIECLLTPLELEQIAWVAGKRQLLNRAGRDAHGFTGDPIEIHMQGAAAEFAVAKTFNVFWNAVVEWGQVKTLSGDVGNLQVRSTPYWDGKLILHETDPDDAGFMLVVGKPPLLGVVGWCYGRDGKQTQFWRTDVREPCFMVPQAHLKPTKQRAE